MSRLNVNINDRTAAEIHALMAEHGITATEVVRRAVGVYRFIDYEKTQGSKIQLRKGRTITEVVIL